MNTKIKSLIIFCVAIICSACESLYDDLFSSPQEGVELTITAVREGIGPDSRTVRLEDGSVEWLPMDEISVFYGNDNNGGSKFTAQNTMQTAIAEFKGRLTDISAGGENFTDGKYIYGVYPYSLKTRFNNGITTISLPTHQTAAEGTFYNGLFPTIARAQGVNLAFYNICGGVKFTVSRDDITSVTFKGNAGERVAGMANVTFDSSDKPIVLDEEIESKNEITVYAPAGGCFEVGKDYYIVAYPTTLTSGFTMTFRTSDMKEGSYISETPTTIERSIFGIVSEADSKVTKWTDYAMGGGGYNSGIYLGIIGFNDIPYPYPISELTESSKPDFYSFIDDLNMKIGTTLYYSVDRAITTLQTATYPSDLYNVAIVTFTDGLDQGSHMRDPSHGTDEAYLAAVRSRLTQEKVAGREISAYSIGLRGSDVDNINKFYDNLDQLASSPDNSYEVSSIDELNTTFQQIAGQLEQTSYLQKISIKIPGQANGTKVRFTLDNVSSAENSKFYIEGVFDLNTRSLTNVTYNGLTSTSGETVNGTVDGIFVTFDFDGIVTNNKTVLSKNYIKHWNYVTSTSSWQINSEFDKNENAEVITEKRSMVVMLVLDCSSSLSTDFPKVQENTKSFIETLLSNQSGNGNTNPGSNLVGSQWIDPTFAKALERQGYIFDAETTTPAEVADITEIDVSGTNSSRGSITSLRGIEYFTSLKSLSCAYNSVKAIDISTNTRLTTLNCSYNTLSSLDISKNTRLTELDCSNNQISDLDVSNNARLTSLICSDNKLSQLKVNNNVRLTYLNCWFNQLTQLDLSKNTQLTTLFCGSNKLTHLDISKNTQLTELYCHFNQLTQLDLSKNMQLRGLDCGYNQLTELDISNNTQLTNLHCYSNQLTQLDISKNTQLTYLYCYFNQLTQLDLSKNTQLRGLDCGYNQLTQLDISNNTALTRLLCYGNPGTNRQFRIKAWFDNSNVSSAITEDEYYQSSWTYDGSTVSIYYYK